MVREQTVVLTSTQVDQKVRRIAHQIYESYHEESQLVLVGVAKRGYSVAERIHHTLSEISDQQLDLCALTIHKDEPLSTPCELSMDTEQLRDSVVILIDDVLNSGRTLIYGCSYLLGFEPKRMTTAVLVDRRHRKFPIRADFVGLTLSTTLQEHISVDMEVNQVVLV